MTDRQAAEAVRDKISWKYALGLGLDGEGFDASVLSEFRTRVVDVLLDALKTGGLVAAGGKARTDSTP
jgi:transposase